MGHIRFVFIKKVGLLWLLFLQGSVLPQFFMDSVQEREACLSGRFFPPLLHFQKHMLFKEPSRILSCTATCAKGSSSMCPLLTNWSHNKRPWELLSCGAECSHTATSCIMPENIMSFVQFLHVLEQNTKKEAKESPAFVCNLHRHLCTHNQDIHANSQLHKHNR